SRQCGLAQFPVMAHRCLRGGRATIQLVVVAGEPGKACRFDALRDMDSAHTRGGPALPDQTPHPPELPHLCALIAGLGPTMSGHLQKKPKVEEKPESDATTATSAPADESEPQ